MREWKTISGSPVPSICKEILRLNEDSPRQIHIGTDAQYRGTKMVFATAIAVLNPGKGGMAYYSRIAFPGKDFRSLAQKLFKEVELSIAVATEISNALDLEYHENIIVHVDANPNVQHSSSDYHRALVGWVAGAGFGCLSKPESWCASNVADHIANGRNVRDTRARRKEFPRKKGKKCQ